MKEKEIKKFEGFRRDDEGVYYYFYDLDENNNWSYDLEHLEEYIVDLQHELSTEREKLNKIKEYIQQNVSGEWSIVDTSVVWEIEEIIEGNEDK